jgi:hypothetical protein
MLQFFHGVNTPQYHLPGETRKNHRFSCDMLQQWEQYPIQYCRVVHFVDCSESLISQLKEYSSRMRNSLL